MNVENVTIQGDSFIFEERCKVLTLKGDLLRMITEYEFNEPSSPNAKIPIDFLDEMNFLISMLQVIKALDFML